MGFFGWGEETVGKSDSPPLGNLPESGRKVFESAYESCQAENPDYSKKKCAMIAWGAVKKKWEKDKKTGKWSKKE